MHGVEEDKDLGLPTPWWLPYVALAMALALQSLYLLSRWLLFAVLWQLLYVVGCAMSPAGPDVNSNAEVALMSMSTKPGMDEAEAADERP